MELWGKQWKPVNLDRPPSALEKGQQEWSGGQWEETWQVEKPRERERDLKNKFLSLSLTSSLPESNFLSRGHCSLTSWDFDLQGCEGSWHLADIMQ